ncbi:MAG: hypothetical protein IAE91_11230 [Ignavibacteriaceae bacterium]|nr:hypothetical protein [Ignavibacteriaceae bacterium]
MPRLRHILIITMLFFSFVSYSQTQVRISIFGDLGAITLPSIIPANGLQGSPRLFSVDIVPTGEQVIVEARFEWRRPQETNFNFVYRMKTEPLTSRLFYNDEIGNDDIRIAEDESNKPIIDENLAKGNPSGTYRIQILVYRPDGTPWGFDQQEVTFTNPAQNFEIIYPRNLQTVPEQSIFANWTGIQGASEYIIRACKVPDGADVQNASVLITALNSDATFITNRSVGASTNVDLRSIMEVVWNPGDVIVWQVKAQIPGPGGGTLVTTTPEVFKILGSSPNTGVAQLLASLLAFFPPEKIDPRIYTALGSGNIGFSGFVNEDGSPIPIGELLSLLSYLLGNPDELSSINLR